MKRTWTTRAAAAALALTMLAGTRAPADEAPKGELDWVFVYYMAYDNNLEACGRPILNMLREGVTSDRVVVTCQSDFTDRDGMRRYVLTKAGGEVETKVAGEGMAEEETLREYLDWVRATYKAPRYAVVFLDHGGRLGEMSNDDNPGRPGGQSWLEVVETGGVCADFRRDVKKAGGEVELLFLQQCGKGTLENYHAFKDTAQVIMGSQTVVGAPNSYYAATLRWAGEHPTATGVELAARLREDEAANMFTTYTTVSGAALDELPRRLEPVLAPLLAKEGLNKLKNRLRPCFEPAPDEGFFDGFALLDALYETNELDVAPLEAFKAWVREALIVGHRVSPRRTQVAGTWCGFSMFVPLSGPAKARYKHYPIYADTELDVVLDRWLKPRPAAAPQAPAPTPPKEPPAR